jgi:hypothetical protein
LLLPCLCRPDRVAGKADPTLKELSLSSTTTERPLDPAVSDRTWPERTGVDRLSSSLIVRVTKHPSPEAKLADTRHRGNIMNAGLLFPILPEPSI